MKITTDLYVDYILNAYERIRVDEEYITDLDLATGDGDHWANMNSGFSKLVSMEDELRQLNLQELFKKIGMTMMAVIGGSSGVLYGGAYIASSSELEGKEFMDLETLYNTLNAMLNDMMTRGKTEPGWKTMIDSLHPAVTVLEKFVNDSEVDDIVIANALEEAALNGAEATKDMEAVRGRASYQGNKGIGHLDPGAVTMAYQLSELSKLIRSEEGK